MRIITILKNMGQKAKGLHFRQESCKQKSKNLVTVLNHSNWKLLKIQHKYNSYCEFMTETR